MKKIFILAFSFNRGNGCMHRTALSLKQAIETGIANNIDYPGTAFISTAAVNLRQAKQNMFQT